MAKKKKAWLWVVDWGKECSPRVSADLFFSTPTKLFEIVTCLTPEKAQLVEVEVPTEFDHWDFVPENY